MQVGLSYTVLSLLRSTLVASTQSMRMHVNIYSDFLSSNNIHIEITPYSDRQTLSTNQHFFKKKKFFSCGDSTAQYLNPHYAAQKTKRRST